jgi:AcrR family transcriptional regulator
MPRAERELQMIAVAEEVFAERGYLATSMDEVAERCGVSKPMIYEYFGSKEGLLLACIRAARAELMVVTERAMAGRADVEDMLRSGLRAYFRFIDEHAKSWSLVSTEAALVGESAGQEIEATRAQQINLMIGVLSEHGPFPAWINLEAAAEMTVGACERLAFWRRSHPEVTPEHAAEYVVQVLWFGMSRHLQR